MMGASAMAELGFIVVMVDGRGTPLRSKAFLEESYGKLGQAGNLDDHIAALQPTGATSTLDGSGSRRHLSDNPAAVMRPRTRC